MRRRALIHVGLEKTGSTAIQAWLANNRSALLEAGILVPKSLGALNHTRLVAACLDDGVVDDIKAHLLARNALDEGELRARIRTAFDTELRRTIGWTQLVITSELISSRLHTSSEISRLIDWLSPYVDDLHVVVFLRRQDDLAVSRFSSALRAGYSSFENIWADLSHRSFLLVPAGRVVDDAREYFEYSRILARFEAVPELTVSIIPYDSPAGPCDVVGSFRSLLGLPVDQIHTRLPRANSALSVEAQYIISQLNRDNRVLWPSGARNEPYRALLRRVEKEQRGTKRKVTRDEAKAFVKSFEESNARIATRYGNAALFRTDFSQWPEAVDYGPIIESIEPTLNQYRAEAAILPQTEPVRHTLRRVFLSFKNRISTR